MDDFLIVQESSKYGRFCTDHFLPFLDLTKPGPGVYTWFSLYYDVVYNNMMHYIISQHYQKDADGLCCRLKHSIDKAKDVEYVVSMSDFKDSTLYQTFLPIGVLIFSFHL